MIRIEGNKSTLYQWDLNMRVILTNAPAGTEVHYSNTNDNTDENCITAVSYSENGCVYADIPNKLLQINGIILVYIYIQDEDKAWTEFKTEIVVLPRKKPANYVYTETEIKTFESLEKRIGNLNDLDTEAKDNLVAAINEAAQTGSGGGGGSTVELDTTLTQSGKAADAKAVGDALAGKQDSGNYVKSVNGTAPDASGNVTVEAGGGGSGIYVGDTAPSDTSMLWVDTSDNEGSTVDSVNGKTGTVVLTAEDVGAMPAGASTDYTLPVATAETLGGVKVGEGLSIDASGVLSASGGGSSGGGGGVPTWSLLGEYDMSTIADSTNISLTGLDNLTYLYFKWEALQNETSTDSNYWLSINGKQLGPYILSRKSGTSNYGYTICKWNGLVWEIQMSAGAISDTNYTLNTGNALFPYNHVFGAGACTTLSAFISSSTYKPVSGVLKIYGGK